MNRLAEDCQEPQSPHSPCRNNDPEQAAVSRMFTFVRSPSITEPPLVFLGLSPATFHQDKSQRQPLFFSPPFRPCIQGGLTRTRRTLCKSPPGPCAALDYRAQMGPPTPSPSRARPAIHTRAANALKPARARGARERSLVSAPPVFSQFREPMPLSGGRENQVSSASRSVITSRDT